jgi:hypothetical protein
MAIHGPSIWRRAAALKPAYSAKYFGIAARSCRDIAADISAHRESFSVAKLLKEP